MRWYGLIGNDAACLSAYNYGAIENIGETEGFLNQSAHKQGVQLKNLLDVCRSVIENNPIDRDRGDWQGELAILCHGFRPENVSLPKGIKANFTKLSVLPENDILGDEMDGDFFYIITSCVERQPVLVRLDDSWMLVPFYYGAIPVISRYFPGDTFIYSFVFNEWDTTLSNYSMLLRPPDRFSMKNHDIEKGLIKNPVKNELSLLKMAYLYEFENSYRSIVKLANYMATTEIFPTILSPYIREIVVPFDLALLCAEKIYWEFEEDQINAFAKLPSLDGNEMFERVPLWGSVPVFREGWSFMEHNADHLEIPERIRELSQLIKGRSSINLTNESVKLFEFIFFYETHKLEERTNRLRTR